MMIKTIITLLVLLTLSFNLFAATDINKASQTELESLSGIGPAKAKAIIAYRKQHGGFTSIEELEKVDGIGPATLKKLSKEISVTKKTMINEEALSKGRITSSFEYESR